ncbi:lytic polysaccharide monooxygenase [Melanomma pulvis-pyrius CBS 109.77]|uniref:lytic cellulose monooxygenase (C4-dehydrogenating) n=1 Tax=Melanomma pulvis-pyrius CBS 109.77 TaxID=1314802 RepID=A0A6A6XPD2_9PLEO|nr:lytic polysaccharide monooxygenase [Melanomma pulvis-pyrius CBS 109.77]
MKFTLSLIVGLAILDYTSAHYSFSRFIVNETVHPQWKYVRYTLAGDPDLLAGRPPDWANDTLVNPIYNIHSLDYRCGRNGTVTGPNSDIATVVAGSKVGFRPGFYNLGDTAFHDGPLFAYLSKSPAQTVDGLKTWDGDGDYFKIAEMGPYNKTKWFNLWEPKIRFSEFNFTIPATTPPGFYLLRADGIYPRAEFNHTQLYASCAQVEIVGLGGGSTPGPTVKFPGAFDEFDEGVWIPQEIANHSDLTRYKMPGPKLWTG